MKRRVLFWLFTAYCVVMLVLLFGRAQVAMNVNLQPLRTIMKYLHRLGGTDEALRRHAVINLVGNVVMFLPLGILPPMLWQSFRSLGRCLLRCGGAMVCVEMLQLVTLLGSCDVDDLLLNLAGIGLGYGVSRLVSDRCTEAK